MKRSSPERQFRKDQLRLALDKAKLAEAEGKRDLAMNRVSLFLADARIRRRNSTVELGRNLMRLHNNFAQLYIAPLNPDREPLPLEAGAVSDVGQPPEGPIARPIEYATLDEKHSTTQGELRLVGGND
jgi:hypothetical protein